MPRGFRTRRNEHIAIARGRVAPKSHKGHQCHFERKSPTSATPDFRRIAVAQLKTSMQWSGRAPAWSASKAGAERLTKRERHFGEAQHHSRRDEYRYHMDRQKPRIRSIKIKTCVGFVSIAKRLSRRGKIASFWCVPGDGANDIPLEPRIVGREPLVLLQHFVVFGNRCKWCLGYHVHDLVAAVLKLTEQFRQRPLRCCGGNHAG